MWVQIFMWCKSSTSDADYYYYKWYYLVRVLLALLWQPVTLISRVYTAARMLLHVCCAISPSTATLLRPAPSTRAFIIAEEKGWASRPLVPELAQSSSAVTAVEERTPWEWKRFLKQSSEFIELPSLPSLTSETASRVIRPGESFGDLQLFPLDDVVMGGASSSSFDNARRKWAGEVTTRNSGGFVGIRSKSLDPPLDCSAAQGVLVRVRPVSTTPLRYKVVLRDSTDFNGICYAASFDVGTARNIPTRLLSGGVETVRVPFSELVPTIFARTVPEAQINLRNVVAVQFALSKFEYDGGLSPLFTPGPFEIDIVDIAAF
tara:strand:- start:152 stop:1108 length:957 start_codon:yes stop_codon:yes gene_type:complete